MRISDNTRELVTALRDAIHQDGGLPSAIAQELAKLPDFEGSKATAGYRVTPNGDITDDHWWIAMDDESIFDASDDEPVRCSKKDSRHEHYFPYSGDGSIPVEVLNFADHVKAKTRKANNKNFTEMVVEASDEPYINGHLSGEKIVWVDMLYVPRNMRRTGVGTKMYLDWEKHLPPTVERVLIHVSDTEGEGQPWEFWNTLGFESPFFIPSWLDISEVNGDALARMWKGVNGHPTPEPEEYEVEDEDDMNEVSGAAPASDVARQAPEALPDAMTVGGQEGVPAEPFDDEVRPEDMQFGLEDLLDEDDEEDDDEWDDFDYDDEDEEDDVAFFMDQEEEDEFEEIGHSNVINAILATGLPVQGILFHGSRARGDHNQHSDWDYVVIFPDSIAGSKFTNIAYQLQAVAKKLPSRVDIQAGLQSSMNKEGTVEWWAAKEGDIIYSSATNEVVNAAQPTDMLDEDMQLGWNDLLNEDSSVPQPTPQDITHAIEHINQFDDTNYTENDFELTFAGYMHPDDLEEYDDFGSWVEVDPGGDTEEEMQFRGSDWAQRAKGWGTDKIPPIIVVFSENHTEIGDGRGRVQMAIVHDIKIPVYFLKHKKLVEVDHPDYMPGGEGGTNNYDPTYDERNATYNTGSPAP